MTSDALLTTHTSKQICCERRWGGWGLNSKNLDQLLACHGVFSTEFSSKLVLHEKKERLSRDSESRERKDGTVTISTWIPNGKMDIVALLCIISTKQMSVHLRVAPRHLSARSGRVFKILYRRRQERTHKHKRNSKCHALRATLRAEMQLSRSHMQ